MRNWISLILVVLLLAGSLTAAPVNHGRHTKRSGELSNGVKEFLSKILRTASRESAHEVVPLASSSGLSIGSRLASAAAEYAAAKKHFSEAAAGLTGKAKLRLSIYHLFITTCS